MHKNKDKDLKIFSVTMEIQVSTLISCSHFYVPLIAECFMEFEQSIQWLWDAHKQDLEVNS